MSPITSSDATENFVLKGREHIMHVNQKITLYSLIIVCITVLFSIPVFALDPYEWQANAEDNRSFERVSKRFDNQLKLYDYPAVFLELQQDLERSPVWTHQEPVYKHLHQAMLELNKRFSNFAPNLEKANQQLQAVENFLDEYSTGLFQCPGEICFKDEFEVNYEELIPLPDKQAEDFLYQVTTINRLLNEFKKPITRETVIAIKVAKTRWDMFAEKGMSQLPWEALLNGWAIGADDIQYPPSHQWILLHPGLGVEVSTGSLKDLSSKESLAIELIGHVWYKWQDHDRPAAGLDWWGVSLLTTLRDDMRPGIGFMVHRNRFIRLGLVWHDDDLDSKWFDESPYLIMSIDLFRFAQDRAPEFVKKKQAFLGAKNALFSRHRQ